MGNDAATRVREEGFLSRNIGRFGVLSGLALVLASPALVWWLLPENPLQVVVMDATVPHPTYREHESLSWILNHARTSPPPGRPWTVDRDYVGYYPERLDASGSPVRDRLSARHLEGADLLYVADTYGVYTEDLEDPHKVRTALDYSERIWGGFNEEETQVILDFARRGGHVVGEFNTFASPTSGQARQDLQGLFQADWTEWSGRYFEELSDVTEVPEWARRHYQKHYQEPWTFQGPGWMLSHEDSRILVLQPHIHVGSRGVRITDVDRTHPLMKDVDDDVPFAFWFDVVTPRPGARVLARYRMDVTEAGRQELARFGLEPEFPAVVLASDAPLALYMAGDFSDNHLDRGPYWIAGWANFRSLGGSRSTDQRGFFWSFQVPLVEAILDRPGLEASP